MTDCPTCEYHKQRAQLWRDEAYRLAGHPLPERDPLLRKPRLDQGADYERGFIDGMQYQMQSSVDKAVNAMSQRTWVDLTDDEMLMIYGQDHEGKKYNLGRMVQQALKEKNT